MKTLLSNIKLVLYAALPVAFILTVLSAICSCRGNVSYPARLVQADSLLYAHPDSSLRILEGYADSARTALEPTRMYYDLLLTTAKDKRYIKHTNDSIMLSVVAYYEHHGPQDKLARAYYIMGRVYDDMQNYTAAVEYYQKAIDALLEQKNYRLLAVTYSQLGELYLEQRLEQESTYCYRRSYYYAVKGKDSLNLSYAMQNLGRTFTILDNVDSALFYYEKAFKLQSKPEMKKNLVYDLASIYLQIQDFNNAHRILLSNKEAYILWADYYDGLNKIDSAKKYYEKSLSDKNLFTKEYAYRKLSKYAENEHDKDSELKYLKLSDIYKDSVFDETRTAEVKRIENFYNTEKLKEERNKLASEKDIQTHINIILLVTLFFFITLAYVFYVKLKIKYIFKKDQNKRVEYLKDEKSHASKQKIEEHPFCFSIITNASKKEFALKECDWVNLQNDIDLLYSDFTKRLRIYYPRIKDFEIIVCCLVKLGLRNAEISNILNYSSNGISSLRKRLYEKIQGKSGTAKDLDDFIRKF